MSEYHGEILSKMPQLKLSHIIQIAQQILEALCYLNKHGLVHRCLSPDNILINNDANVKLFNYGLYYMTNGGGDVLFPVG